MKPTDELGLSGLDPDATIRHCQKILNTVPDLLAARDRALAEKYVTSKLDGIECSHRILAEQYGMSETTVRGAVHRHRDAVIAARAATGRAAG